MARSSSSRAASARLALVGLEARDVPTFYGNQLFPLDNPWNQNISAAPVAANSDAIINAMIALHKGTAPGVHPDFGNPLTDGALYGIPVNVVDGTTVPAVPVTISPSGWANESDVVPVPIPANAVIEGDGPTGPAPVSARSDSHLLVYDKAANILYELVSAARPTETSYTYGGSKPLGVWGAYAEAVWNLNTNTFRTVGKTSADAAGLPILPGLVRPDEALPAAQGGQGAIKHAIRMTVQQTQDMFVYPASHQASSLTGTDLPRMGDRFRLKAGFVIPANWSPEVKAIAQAMKDYGMIVADNGSDMYFQGTPSAQWDMNSVLQIEQINASDFEVVDLTPVVTGLSVAFGSPGGGTAVTVTGRNFSGAAGQLHVLFGTAAATSVIILSDSQLVATSPAGAGTVDVHVQSGGPQTDKDGNPVFFGYGTSAATPADRFTFGNAPAPRPDLVGYPQFAAGTDAGGPGTVTEYNPDGSVVSTAAPFPGFTGGVRTAVADFNGDGTPDLAVGTGPGTTAEVIVYDGKTRQVLFDVMPFAAFTGGVFVAAGTITGTGSADLVITPDQSGGPRVEVYRGGDFALVANFFGIADPNFRGGARVAVGDITGDGHAEVIVSAGFGGGPRISVYDGAALLRGQLVHPVADFFAFEPALRNGAYVAAGDVDGTPDLIFGAGPGGGPRVLIVSGQALVSAGSAAALGSPVANFFAGNVSNRGGVRVAVKNLDNDRFADVLTGAGPGGGSRVTAYLGKTLTAGSAAVDLGFDAFPGSNAGVYVG
ncbi:MAG: hypothetical protein JWO38_4476 [Gemmataceae bacterium]|nr:hypothetical protein [Gemmataceae bacterium]